MTVIVDDPLDTPLVPPSHSFIVDPVLSQVVESDYRGVDVANPTAGPNRLTVHVPTAATVLSLGAPSGDWDTDMGITAHTAAHIHFETKVSAAATPPMAPPPGHKTVVSLGDPATTASITGYAAKPEAKEGKEGGKEGKEGGKEGKEGGKEGKEGKEGEPAAAAVAPVGTQGYSMVTDCDAWHFSWGQHYLLSQGGDISMRTIGPSKRAVVQATLGTVDINGGKEVNLIGGSVAIGAQAKITIADVAYTTPATNSAPLSVAAENVSFGNDCIGALTALHDLTIGGIAIRKKAWPKKGGRINYLVADLAKWAADGAIFLKSARTLAAGIKHETAAPGCVKISAQGSTSCAAGKGVGLFGLQGATIGSAGLASVGAGLMASLKGTLFAGVGGTLTSLKAVKRMEVNCDVGDLAIGAKQNVEFTADEAFLASGDELAQISSEEEVLIGSSNRVWIGTPAGEGWGALLNSSGVAFGRAKKPKRLKGASIEADNAIRIDASKITLDGSVAHITLTDKLCLIEGPAVHFDAKKKNVSFLASMQLVFK